MSFRILRSARKRRTTLAPVLLVAMGAAADAVTPTALSTQQVMARPQLVLGRIYDQARAANPRAAAARALARAAEARVSSARRPSDPQLQLGFMNYALPGLRPMDPLGMTQLQLMQMVPTAGKLGLSGRVATAQASAAGERAADVSWEARTQAAMAFYELYAADCALQIDRATIRLLQDIVRTAEAMYRVGEGRQADVLRAQLEIARMTEDTLRMRAMRTAIIGRLAAVLNETMSDSAASPVLPLFPDTVSAIDSLLDLAETNRPMVRAGEQDVRAADAAERLARREIWPDLQIGVAYGQRSGAMSTERMGSLMIGTSLPIFARDRQLRMREEAAAMRQMAAADLTAMRAETRGRVVETHANLMRARRLAQLYRTTVIPQAEAAAASAFAAYRVGSVDFMTLLDNRMTVNRYRKELFTIESDEGKAWAELEMLIGRQLFDPFTIARDVAAGSVR